jgi:amidase
MCAELPSLIDATRRFISQNTWVEDFEVLDLPWNNDNFTKIRNRICQPGKNNGNLVFGIMRDDGEVIPHPPVQRAIDMVTNALHQHGYEVN